MQDQLANLNLQGWPAWCAGKLFIYFCFWRLRADWRRRSTEERDFVESLKADFRYHYSSQPLTEVAVGFGVTALLANSGVDENTQRFFRDKMQGQAGDSLTKFFTGVGDVAQPLYSIPIYLAMMWAGGYNSESESVAARWAADSLRGVLIGTPELIVLGSIAGGHAPAEGEPGWRPFDSNNGVSGHAFLGAVPIITAAKMTDKRWLKYTLYTISTFPGLARIYDEKHYLSQAVMGWWLASVASRTVEHTNIGRESTVRLIPLLYPDGAGLQVSIRF